MFASPFYSTKSTDSLSPTGYRGGLVEGFTALMTPLVEPPQTPRQQQLLPGVCPDINVTFNIDTLMQLYPNGLGTDAIANNSVTGRMPIAALQAHIAELQASGAIPTDVADPRTQTTNMGVKEANDKAFHKNIQDEYCFYEARYKYAMGEFLKLSTSLNPADVPTAQRMLLVTQSLNRKINSVLEITNMLNDSRVESTNMLKTSVQSSNQEIKSTADQLNKEKSFLGRDNLLIETQKEMIIYTKEKNEHVLNQISLFTIMTAFAVGAIFAIWRS